MKYFAKEKKKKGEPLLNIRVSTRPLRSRRRRILKRKKRERKGTSSESSN